MPVRGDIDPRILLIDQRIECQTCHRAAGTGEDLLVELESRSGLCLGCHRKVGGGDIALTSSAPGRQTGTILIADAGTP